MNNIINSIKSFSVFFAASAFIILGVFSLALLKDILGILVYTICFVIAVVLFGETRW